MNDPVASRAHQKTSGYLTEPMGFRGNTTGLQGAYEDLREPQKTQEEAQKTWNAKEDFNEALQGFIG